MFGDSPVLTAVVLVLLLSLGLPKLAALQREANVNLALQKPTRQSSTRYTWGPDRAVDGNPDPLVGEYTCSETAHTHTGFAWWWVDLLSNYWISKVRITTASASHPDLFDYRIEVSPVDPSGLANFPGPTQSSLCVESYRSTALPVGQTVNLPCTKPVWGRFVRIFKTRLQPVVNSLAMCEFEVFDVSPWRFRKVESDTITQDDVIVTIPGRSSQLRCASHCVQHSGRTCRYFQLHNPSGACQLLHTLSENGILTRSPKWSVYELVQSV